jgi:hypothetical protein
MAVEGNDNVLKVIEHIKAIAQQGRTNAIAIIHADSSGVDSCYVAQSGISESWLNLGLDLAKNGMMKKLTSRQSPVANTEVHGSIKANKVIFNAANLTLGYDFLAWLMAAEMRRIKHGIEEPLEVGFAVGSDFRDKPQDPMLLKQHNFDHMMMDNVCLPLVGMMGGKPAQKVDETFLWPPSSCFRDAVELFNEGIPIPRVAHDSASALAMAKHTGVVTITLREAAHWGDVRNSDLEVWMRVGKWLEERGETVLFVRDTAKASEPLPGFRTEPMASTDINCRAALYAVAKANLFISNGPATLDWFCGDAASLTFIPLSETDGYKCSQRDWWEPNHGIRAGDQFPWFPPYKKIVWEQPTFEGVTRAYEELFNGNKVKRRLHGLARPPRVLQKQRSGGSQPLGTAAQG